MKKCEKCGKEVLFPFTCTYCGKDYCDEHRLPESHECSNMPRESPPYISSIAPEDKTPRVELCPKCHFAQSDMITYDAESMTFKCRRCGFKYSQLKASPHDYVEPKDKTESKEKPKTRRSFPVKKIIGLALVLIIVGALLWYAPTIISYVQNLASQSSYTKVTVVMGQVAVYEHDNNRYSFTYRYLDPSDSTYFTVNSYLQQKTFSTTEGATYTAFGIEIKVSEVHSDYIVLLVKPTY